MRRFIVKAIILGLVVLALQGIETAAQNPNGGKSGDLDQAVAYAIDLEVHASHLENRADVCIGLGHGLALDEQKILTELRAYKVKIRSGQWCNDGPRGIVIAIVPPTEESAPSTFDITIQVGDLRPIRESGEHFATMVRRGTYIVKFGVDSGPELISYQRTVGSGKS